MGKYIKKPKPAGEEAAVTELPQASLGVRTRSKTLALQRQKKSPTSPAPANGAGLYLQLRSRRLEKPPVVVHNHHSKTQQQQGRKKDVCGQNLNPNSDSRARVSCGSNSVVEKKKGGESERGYVVQEDNGNDNIINCNNVSVEASFGENILDIEAKERGTRESTPCSLIRDPEIIRTPGSTTRPTNSADTNRRLRSSTRQRIPTSHEMDEFFAPAEVDQQRQFIEKYNFDPVKDKPLPGRYEWEKVDP
ncbi:inhibitor/interactor with cyclin-dependent kinase, KIP-RELATED PROTEIN 3 [Hibiscus trionum]|uniref:Inhibitor/interactor with cyclin-dependent kinase, KIP-RELATED PROTEIN 3 n=1 Tax=Hibiscus trionum TaxID=183268 RepID=A0A9W7H736_HIBTR|nr:inhibitor/interactor with cyclin-dependent kinase, KIP-RELATED PROTEIN 3 [Hibiscus trionum]